MSSSLGKIQSDSEKYLLQHRFGDQLEDDEVEDEELVKAFEEYKVRSHRVLPRGKKSDLNFYFIAYFQPLVPKNTLYQNGIIIFHS